MGAGSTYQGTAGSWGGSNLLTTSAQTSVVGTSGATFYITGVQLEKGSTATSFDYRPYGTEFALCQRYYYSYVPGSYVDYAHPITNDNASAYRTTTVYFPVNMRAAATLTSISVGGTSTAGPNSASAGVSGAYFQWNAIATTSFLGLNSFNASAEL
jgi:hypothetical protein